MTTWVLLGLLATTPPPVPDDAPLAEAPQRSFRVAPRTPRKADLTPEEPANFGLMFAPLSVFGLALFVEAELPLVAGLDVFAVVGGGLAGQFGFEAGLRYYVLDRPMEGFYFDARGSGFALPATEFWMLGPGLQLGYAWRIRRFALSLGGGFTTWWTVNRGNPQSFFFGRSTDAEVIALPGLQVPAGNGPAVQPTLRVAIGFTL